ncbi:MAG: phosphoglucomutase/phosphomannomutase family protein [Candidatus Obscuribacterales bacterium]|nr:phosphoglucomutase/phosphomannomutase family protein [Candidatus Obscuribacterales bacterium]
MSQITFGTDGWRAVIAEDFTFANVEKVAYAIGQYINSTYNKNGKRSPILVGYDTRFLADSFARRAAQVFISMGIPAKLADRDVPTPVIAYATQNEETVGAVQLTASHNPPEYCGIKYIPEYAGPATNEITERIVEHLSDLPFELDVHSIEVPTFSPKAPYMAAIKEMVDFERIAKAGLKVGVECLYSTSRDYLDAILKEHGVDTRVLHNWRDPMFGGGMPEPKAQYLTDLSKLVVQEKLNLGLATDGDADRFAIIDDSGAYVSANQLLALLTMHMLKNRKETGGIVKTVATTHFLDRLAKANNLEIFETPVGFKYIGELMRQKDILIGGEESGGCSVKGHIPEKDGILCNLLIVEMLAYEKKSLSQIWSELVAETGVEFAYRRKDMRLTNESQKKFVETLQSKPFEKIGNTRVEKVGTLDGFKYYLEDESWILVRPSGTEPLVRFYFEAPSSKRVDELKADFDKMIDDILQGIGARLLAVH